MAERVGFEPVFDSLTLTHDASQQPRNQRFAEIAHAACVTLREDFE